MGKKDYDIVVIGSGPNGFAAAITLQQEGLSVLLIEGKSTVGGGMRTETLTLPGFFHDVCSGVHPLAASSPFFERLPLSDHHLRFIYPPLAAAHPFDDGITATMQTEVGPTAESLPGDQKSYRELMEPLVRDWQDIFPELLGPLHFPQHPSSFIRFGLKALLPATLFVKKYFRGEYARGLFAGMAAHSMIPLSAPASAAYGLVMMGLAHAKGWPVAKGGSSNIARALASYFTSLGGKIELNFPVSSLKQIPSSLAVMLDVSPRQLLQIAGQQLSVFYAWQLKRYRYGMGVFKIDWALAGSIPFRSPDCLHAGTIHLGNSFQEIASAEQMAARGICADKPFVILSQPSLFDPSRAPTGSHTGWAYCHVPASSLEDRTEAIEKQVERFAPGFRDRILTRHVMNTAQLEEYNPNYVGGDINGGSQNLSQLFTRPALRFSPYRTSVRGIYLCSASTPPGGGVHGMCGYHAARQVIKDIFNKKR